MKNEKLVKEWIEEALSYKREDLHDLHSHLTRLSDYVIDGTPNGYAFDEKLSEKEKMWIIYNILDILRTWVRNLSEHKVIWNNKDFLKNIEKNKGHRIYLSEEEAK